MKMWKDGGKGSLYVLIGVSGRQPCFSRTVNLTLSLKCFIELLLILKESVTPCLEHLTVTFEDDNSTVRNLEDFYQDKNILTESHLVTMNVMHLHTLTLRGSDQSDFSMNNVLLIIRYLKMPNLKSLTLIHVQTSLLNQLIEFRQAVNSSSLWISLKYFRFSLCLPIILRYEYETTEFGDVIFNTSNWLARGWGVRHIVEEHLSSTILVVYTYPCDLQNERILVNHRFVARTIDYNRQANVDHMVWLCRNSHTDSIDLHSSASVEHSLKILSRVYHLKWYWYTSPIGFSASNFMQHKSYFPLHLRSLHLQVIGVDDTQTIIYVNLLRNLMTNAVLLQCLSVPWNVVRELGRCCSSTPSYRLTSLFLYFERSRPIPGQVLATYEPEDGSMLSQLFPRLRHLSLYGGFYLMNKQLVDMCQNLIDSLTCANHLFNLLHVSCTSVHRLPAPQKRFVLAEIRKWLCLTRDSSTFSLYSWEHFSAGQLTIWL
ncbi:unnamed protein product [Adineta steineri]|uniref:Uncharacterized protein n=1 Tax=Adineta steineri TaxID=433720 RepID=A0A815GCZ8_9BILA|nr:unnamed protein product [Adineta steineri]